MGKKSRRQRATQKVERSALSVLINGKTYVMARQPTGDVIGGDDYLVHATTMLDLRQSMHVRIDALGIDACIHHELLRPRRMETVPHGLVLMLPITGHVTVQFFGLYLIDDAFQAHDQPEVTFDVLGKPGRYVCSVVGVQCENPSKPTPYSAMSKE